MRKIKDAVDLTTNEKIYFKGHAKATYLSDGRNVEDALGEIPTAESDVFKAIYGVTTYDEIKAAYDSGKVVHCDYESFCYVLSRLNENAVYFETTMMTTNYVIYCNANTNKWSALNTSLEKSTNKVTTLSESSTDTQYPSAKAVYDAIQDVEEELNNKQESLVDGQNIKTVNGQSILGEGNIVIDTYDDSEIQQKLTEVIDAVDNLSSIDHTTYAEKEEVYDKTTTDGLLMNLKEFTLLETKDLLDKLAEELNQKINILADISDSDFSKDFERNNDFSMDFNNL